MTMWCHYPLGTLYLVGHGCLIDNAFKTVGRTHYFKYCGKQLVPQPIKLGGRLWKAYDPSACEVGP